MLTPGLECCLTNTKINKQITCNCINKLYLNEQTITVLRKSFKKSLVIYMPYLT